MNDFIEIDLHIRPIVETSGPLVRGPHRPEVEVSDGSGRRV